MTREVMTHATDDQPAPSLKLTLLGTGSPEAYKRRASSGYLLEVGGDKVLIDCGGGVFDRLVQAGHKPSDITHLFFSHLHSDHMMDYARLVHAAWDEGGGSLQVYGPRPLAMIHESLFSRQGALAADLIARTENPGSQEVWQQRGGSLPRMWPDPVINEIEPGFCFQSPSGWKLRSCSVPHTQPQLICMAFRIDTANASVTYSGDSALCAELEALASNTDLLLHWCYRKLNDHSMDYVTRLSPDARQIGQLASRCNVSRVLLTHLRPDMDGHGQHAAMLNAVNECFDGEAGIAEDLMTIDL
ncbi:MAG: MBL fold metallo-hydrolase [Granulosicoccus sp.]|nr:MBL fold metallo-hydrolase [Granulosicoccus sp.]